jgi:hypothetical protein
MSAQYWAHPIGKIKQMVGPFDSEEEAIAAAIEQYPKAKQITYGRGTFGPSFNIQWIQPATFKERQHGRP